MTREIKFRAWDTNGVAGMVELDNWAILGGYLYGKSENGLGDTFTLMQFTGLKDKNGVEIYEGDVLIAKGKETETTTGEKRMTVDDAFSCYAAIRDSIIDKENLEIIGNIYENPEFLK